jgi:hypothetical protein
MYRRCHKCGAILPPGQTGYTVTISVATDFDGVIPDESDIDLKEIEYRTKGVPAELLEEEIHREMQFLLCMACKERFCANPLNIPL